MSGSTLINGKNPLDQNQPIKIGEDGGLGNDNGDYQSGAGALSGGPWSWVYAHADTTLSSVTSPNISGTLTNITIKGGSWWRCGGATAITVSSGEITAYDV